MATQDGVPEIHRHRARTLRRGTSGPLEDDFTSVSQIRNGGLTGEDPEKRRSVRTLSIREVENTVLRTWTTSGVNR